MTVLTLIAHKPDLTLAEIRGELAERHGISVGLSGAFAPPRASP